MTSLFPPLENHSQRIKLHNEAHARQPMELHIPFQASHLALLFDTDQKGHERQHLISLCESYNVKPPAQDTDHFIADFGDFQLRWQQHGEFCTYTVYQQAPLSELFSKPALCCVPEQWLKEMKGEVMAAIHACIVAQDDEPDLEETAAHFSGHALMGSKIANGAAYALTDFQIYEDGFSRFLIIDRHLHPGQAGRYLHRLFDIEVYRIMSLLAFPMARKLIPKLNRADQDLLRITTTMHQSRCEDAELMDEVTALALEVENCFSKTHFRFGAANAYYKLVESRIESLREVRIEGVQTLGEFLQRRLEPAIRTCQIAQNRLSMLSERIGNAGQLLRTRVDITLERQNQALLASMNRRAQLQLHMQTTVEGLSVAAISYYTVSLIGYAAKAGKSFGLPIKPDLVVGISIPVVIVVIALGVRHIRKMVDQVKQEDG